MALTQFRMGRFSGIHQGVCENWIEAGESADACNMDTAGGRLSVAKGYVHAFEIPFPTPADVKRLFVWNAAGGRKVLAATRRALYVFEEGGDAWRQLYAFTDGSTDSTKFDFLTARIGSTAHLLVANGVSGVVKWDGGAGDAAAFGSAEGLSNVAVNYLELYCNRLFAAGDPQHPGRLYWSQAPGGARTVEDWGTAAESENVSGGHVEVGSDADPITGLVALSNQLLIFQRDSVSRLLGDRPDNYRILPVNAAMRQPVHTACTRYGDVPYFLTGGGMYLFDGQSVRKLSDAEKIRTVLENADIERCVSAAYRDRLYFAVCEDRQAHNCADAVIVYDVLRGCYMLRRGFLVRGLCAAGDALYLMDGDGYVCRFEEGDTYAGAPIHAYWKTPLTDLDSKLSEKRLMELYLRGEGGLIQVEAESGGKTVYSRQLMPGDDDVLEAGMTGQGRAFRFCFRNVNGSRFTVDGGVEVLLDMQRRIL